ncbi:MAG: hypothetical protein WBD22_05770 [Pyrinomonadaceae bacterium]
MTRAILLLAFLIVSAVSMPGQTTTPVPTTAPIPAYTPDPYEALRRTRQNNETEARFAALKRGGRRTSWPGKDQRIFRHIESIYRKPTENEAKLLEVNPADSVRFAGVLAAPNTGLTRLIPDLGCAENTSVVNVTANCLMYSMPGAGASYSFRTRKHSIRRLSDLIFTGNMFLTSGFLQHGLLTNIGNVPLGKVTLATPGVTLAADFLPVADIKEAAKADKQIIDGLSSGGFMYSRSVHVLDNTTYILRSIAYRGHSYRTVQGTVYDEFDFDKRRDVLIAFRVVRLHSDQSITIVWKELSNRKSPAIERNEVEEPDIEKSEFLASEND